MEKVNAEAEVVGVTPKPKGLNKGQRARLTKLADQLEKLQEEWHSLDKNNDDAALKVFLPQPLVEAAQKAGGTGGASGQPEMRSRASPDMGIWECLIYS